MTDERFTREAIKLVAEDPMLGVYFYKAKIRQRWLEKFAGIADVEFDRDPALFRQIVLHELSFEFCVAKREQNAAGDTGDTGDADAGDLDKHGDVIPMRRKRR